MRRPVLAAIAAMGLTAAACTADPIRDPASEPQRSPDVIVSQTPIETVTEPAGDWLESACALPFEYVQRVRRGYARGRSPEILFVPREPNFFGGFTSTTHSGPWPYVQDIPIVFYGPGFIRSAGDIELDREVTIADIAPTLAELLEVPLGDRDGRPLTEVLLPEGQRNGKPRMILTVVWDGGGWNVLRTWPQAWPFLRSVMQDGASIQGAIAGSSPTVTPAIHTNLGTGTFPKTHGIVDIPIRVGGDIAGSFSPRSPQYLKVTTLADVWDRRVDNEALVGMFAFKSWHLGMMGHGAYLAGGDRDIAVIAERSAGQLESNLDYYDLPSYLQRVPGFEEDVRAVDLDDGAVDDRWMGHEILNDPSKLRHSPAWAMYQTRLVEALVKREGFGEDDVTDLFYVNYKQVDDIGHDYNMLNEEMREILRYTDDELRKLVDLLDARVGRDRWVLVVTADHGQSPDPMAIGAWPIRIQVLQDDIRARFDKLDNGIDLFQDERPVGFWLDRAEMRANGVTEEELSNYLIDYRLRDNLRQGEKVPAGYRDRLDEPVLAAAFPSDSMARVWRCARAKR